MAVSFPPRDYQSSSPKSIEKNKHLAPNEQCHETTARAARLEQGVPVALMWIGLVGLRGEQGSQHDAVSTVATLPRAKGQRDYAHGGAW